MQDLHCQHIPIAGDGEINVPRPSTPQIGLKDNVRVFSIYSAKKKTHTWNVCQKISFCEIWMLTTRSEDINAIGSSLIALLFNAVQLNSPETAAAVCYDIMHVNDQCIRACAGRRENFTSTTRVKDVACFCAHFS